MSNGNQPLGPPSAGDLPPPYSPYGAPAPIGEPTPYSAIEAISYGGSKLIQNLGSMILVAFGIYLLGGLVQGITSVLQTLVGTVGSTVETCHPSESGAVECITHHNGYLALDLTITGLVFLVSILGAVGTMFLQAGLVRGGFMIVDGQTPSISTMFSGWAKGPYLIIMFLTGIIITIGVMLLIIPGIVAAVFLLWVPALAVDRGGWTDPGANPTKLRAGPGESRTIPVVLPTRVADHHPRRPDVLHRIAGHHSTVGNRDGLFRAQPPGTPNHPLIGPPAPNLTKITFGETWARMGDIW
ncbi:MAG TPA: hypothetical protein PLC19_00435 [Marmoricola sp.]|nr:hypothetical protein [Marmoricola sp.]